MIRVVVLDLGDTLVDGVAPFEHVPEALTALGQLVGPDGTRLTLLLVSDFKMAEPPVTAAKVKALVAEYLALLDGFGLRRFFRPVAKRVTLSTQVGVHKPDRRVYQAALERSGTGAQLDECLAITENGAHLDACRALGMATLQFGVDFTDWADAVELVGGLVTDAAEEAVFTRSLQEHGQLGPAGQPLAPGVTHVVGPDGTGPVRKRFSAI